MSIYLLDLDTLEYTKHTLKEFIKLFNNDNQSIEGEDLSNETRIFTNVKKIKNFIRKVK
jgi:benzoyl-CoA reductase/2-hydroxyglutaryl-CoA dehydratase subunit BcrC/BadD/HgdB